MVQSLYNFSSIHPSAHRFDAADKGQDFDKVIKDVKKEKAK
jgi:hypothetical protein